MIGVIRSRGPRARTVRARQRRGVAAAMLASVLASAVAIALVGCTAPTLIEDSSVTVVTSQAFYSLNDKTSYGASPANSAIIQAANSSFNRYDDSPRLVTDPSFGSYQLLSRDPLTVKYTIADGVTWSDGVPVDASDLLLAWAANSGVLNTPDFDDSDFVDPETGQYLKPFPRDTVYFDGATSEGLQHVTSTPTIGDGGRSLTLSYDEYFADWQLVLQPGVPAHVVAEHALERSSPSDAPSDGGPSDSERIAAALESKSALVTAIDDRATAQLSDIANFWNSGFNFDRMPNDASLLVTSGPYAITDFVPGEQVTLTARQGYSGDHKPTIETVVVKFVSDGLEQVAALADGSANIISPRQGEGVEDALAALAAGTAEIQRGFDGVYEHLDLQFSDSRSGAFDDSAVRAAFLKVVPRADIAKAALGSLGELRASQVFMPGEPGYQEAASENGSAQFERVDVDGAIALLQGAGVSNPSVCILFDPSNPNRVQEFQLIQTSAARAGFRVTNCSSPDWVNLLGTPQSYDAALFAWNVTNHSVTGAKAIFGTEGRNNFSHYSNPEVDSLFDKLGAETADTDRESGSTGVDIRKTIDALLFADSYGVPLYQSPTVVAVDDSVTGVTIAPLSSILWNVWEWKPSKDPN